jgi:S-formylglutathione hydrolase FrmB
MALVSCDFFSEALEVSSSMTVILPQETRTQIGLAGGSDGGLLYLLHGLSDDHTIWQRRTSIERYAAPLGLAVVMPAVHRSFYADERHGHRYWTFLTEELPVLVDSFFRIEAGPSNTYVAGLSMGGYGALKWALRQPERFAAAASLSGALDIVGRHSGPVRAEDPRMFERIYGDADPAGTPDDLFALVDGADPSAAPALYVCCGEQDELLPGNHRFLDAGAAAGLPVTSSFGPGEHDWAYWDTTIQDVLAWLPLPR